MLLQESRECVRVVGSVDVRNSGDVNVAVRVVIVPS